MTEVVLDVYDISGGFLVESLDATHDLQIEWLEVLNQPGSGTFRLYIDHPGVWGLTGVDNVLVVKFDGTPVFAWRTAETKVTLTSDSEHADRWITAQGPGRLADLGWAVQYPTPPSTREPAQAPDRGALDWAPASDDRAWTWCNWNYDLAAAEGAEAWVDCTGLFQVDDPLSPWQGHPVDFPDSGAYWIYPGQGDEPQPPGISYYRERFTLPNSMRVRLFAAADDMAEVWLDEAVVLDVQGWHEIAEATLVLDEGEHLIAPRVWNHQQPQGDTPAGIVWTVMELTIDEETGEEVLGDVLCRSHGTGGGVPVDTQRTGPVRGIANPPLTPGFWPGQMLSLLMLEADERGVETFEWLDWDFESLLDSNGDPYPERLDVLLRLGSNYLHVLNIITQASCDVAITPSGTIQLFGQRGTDRTTGTGDVELEIGQNLTEVTAEGRAVRATSLLCRDDAGWREHRRDAAIAEHGRREDFLADGDASSPDQSARTASMALDLHSVPDEQLTLQQADTPGPLLWKDYFVGDIIWAPNKQGGRQRVRVLSGGGKVTDEGKLIVTPGVAII